MRVERHYFLTVSFDVEEVEGDDPWSFDDLDEAVRHSELEIASEVVRQLLINFNIDANVNVTTVRNGT